MEKKVVPTILVSKQAETRYSLQFLYIEYNTFQELAVTLPAQWVIVHQKHLVDLGDIAIDQRFKDMKPARLDLQLPSDVGIQEVTRIVRRLIERILLLPEDFVWKEG